MCNNEINKINSTVTTAGNSVQRSTAKMSNGFNTAKLSVSKLLSVIGGLSVVQKIVEKYRGKIKILNQEDLTGFYLDLPLKEAFDFLKQQQYNTIVIFLQLED